MARTNVWKKEWYSSSNPNDEPPSNRELGSNKFARKLAAKVLSLYVPSYPISVHDLVHELYVLDATFQDPLVSVRGRNHVMAQFQALRAMVVDTTFVIHSAEFSTNRQDNKTLLVDVDITFTFGIPLLPVSLRRVSLRSHSVCELTSRGRIVSHTDHWSVQSLFERLPVVGRLYKSWRSLFGYCSSVAVRSLIQGTVFAAQSYNGVLDRIASNKVSLDSGTVAVVSDDHISVDCHLESSKTLKQVVYRPSKPTKRQINKNRKVDFELSNATVSA